MKLLVTGAAGYIGSHTCVALLERGHDIVAVDNLANGTRRAVDMTQQLGGRSMVFAELDLLDTSALANVAADHDIDAVIHFAGLKAVGESVDMPLAYYDANVGGAISLLKVMDDHGIKRIIFSSSATVHGVASDMPLTEASARGALSPYGRTKQMIEMILEDIGASDPDFRAINLRYFNPIGAHESGDLGEDPVGTPNNLMPYLMQVAVGRREILQVYGDDYDTPDGTCIRDYIHVTDLADGHVAALTALDKIEGAEAVHLGTGIGSSVFEVIAAAGEAVGRPIPYEVVGRRAGDVPAIYSNPAKARELLDWRANHTLADMCRDTWRWQERHPKGFQD